jgi:succinyl-diaminopimelate desuccinylase
VSASPSVRERVLAAASDVTEEALDFAAALVRIPTVNPPGEAYADAARVIAERLERGGFAVRVLPAEGRPEHTERHPRPNVLGVLEGEASGPCLHLNGHYDVVPPGEGWSVDPFAGLVRDGRLYGRGACDMKAGLAAAVYAAEAVRRAGVRLRGRLELSGTVDEESGGFAGVAWLCERGFIVRGRTDYVIIPEPFGPDRVCVGHRGAWWFALTTHGRIAHGSMPHLGTSAIDHMAALLEAVRLELKPALAARTTRMPVVPPESRRATLNVNTVFGGQAGEAVQTPCVADRCTAIFDRRFLPEEGLAGARRELLDLVARVQEKLPELRFEIEDRMVVHPVETPADSPLVAALARAIREVCGREAALVASPGSYDHKHVARIAGVEQCVAYGPGRLELAHQPDEYCEVADLAASIQVLALAIVELVGVAGG